MSNKNLAIVTATEYVTIRPTASPAIVPSISSTASSITTSSVLLSPTTRPPLSSGFSEPAAPKSEFDDTLVILTLTAIIIMTLLLCALIGYSIYSRCKGECSKCNRLQDQLDKWRRSDLKRITKETDEQRATLSVESSTLPYSKLDVEMGMTDDTPKSVQAAHALALTNLEGQDRGLFWPGLKEVVQNTKDKVAGTGRRAPSPISRPGCDETTESRFPTADIESFAPGYHHSSRSPWPDCERMDDSQNIPPSPAYSASQYSQVTYVNGTRAFSDYFGQPVQFPIHLHGVSGPQDKQMP